MLHGLTTRIEQLLEGSRKADWAPAEPLPSSQSPWVNSLLSYLQVRCCCCAGLCVTELTLSTHTLPYGCNCDFAATVALFLACMGFL